MKSNYVITITIIACIAFVTPILMILVYMNICSSFRFLNTVGYKYERETSSRRPSILSSRTISSIHARKTTEQKTRMCTHLRKIPLAIGLGTAFRSSCSPFLHLCPLLLDAGDRSFATIEAVR